MIVGALPWVLSALLIWSMWLCGGRRRVGWLIAAGSQFLWLYWIAATEAWGLVPGTAVLLVVYVFNWYRFKP